MHVPLTPSTTKSGLYEPDVFGAAGASSSVVDEPAENL